MSSRISGHRFRPSRIVFSFPASRGMRSALPGMNSWNPSSSPPPPNLAPSAANGNAAVLAKGWINPSMTAFGRSTLDRPAQLQWERAG